MSRESEDSHSLLTVLHEDEDSASEDLEHLG